MSGRSPGHEYSGVLPERLLGQVQTPARYIGAELNSIAKEADEVAVRFALAYPDLYEVGMSHIGSHILYHVINQRDDAACERVYLPADDAVKLMGQENLKLGTLETGTPVCECDIFGITLQHELNYTSVLALLELSGLPLRAEQRDSSPLVVGGGPCAFNPEPVVPFFDAFVIGDGEEAVGELIDAFKEAGGERDAVLEAWAALRGVYVPALHNPDRCHITRRVLQGLDSASYPTAPVVPWPEIVHDRAQIEIARGCTRGCRFCQAGTIYRPVRERRVETLLEQAREIIANTGYDEISLVSLNCPDHTQIAELVDALNDEFAGKRISVGLPSLRTDTFSVELAEKVSRVRKSGLTLAPEAGTERLRNSINKQVSDADLLEAVTAAFEAGWITIKLYFMIGLPGETEEDVVAIARLVQQVIEVGRRTMERRFGRLRVNVSVAGFIPKPHTPFQWCRQASHEDLLSRQELLAAEMPRKHVRLACHDAHQAIVEGALARGGRELAEVIERAYQLGCVLDSWGDHFRSEAWEQAFTDCGLSLREIAGCSFDTDERLPWDHIDCGVTKNFLLAELRRSGEGEVTPDCREGRCLGCGMQELVAQCPEVAGDA